TAGHNLAAAHTGLGKLQYLDFVVTGNGSARAVWASTAGVEYGRPAGLALPLRRLLVKRIQTNIQEAVAVVGGSGAKTINIDLVQPPSQTGSQSVLMTLQVLTLNAKK